MSSSKARLAPKNVGKVQNERSKNEHITGSLAPPSTEEVSCRKARVAVVPDLHKYFMSTEVAPEHAVRLVLSHHHLRDLDVRFKATMPDGRSLMTSSVGDFTIGNPSSALPPDSAVTSRRSFATRFAALADNVDVPDKATQDRLHELQAELNASDGTQDTDQQVSQQILSTIQFTDGRYQTRLPWLSPDLKCPDNFTLAFARLASLLDRSTPAELASIAEVVQQQLAAGVIEPVQPKDHTDGPRVHYLAYRPIIKTTDSGVVKVRIVYDGSAALKGQPSPRSYKMVELTIAKQKPGKSNPQKKITMPLARYCTSSLVFQLNLFPLHMEQDRRCFGSSPTISQLPATSTSDCTSLENHMLRRANPIYVY